MGEVFFFNPRLRQATIEAHGQRCGNSRQQHRGDANEEWEETYRQRRSRPVRIQRRALGRLEGAEIEIERSDQRGDEDRDRTAGPRALVGDRADERHDQKRCEEEKEADQSHPGPFDMFANGAHQRALADRDAGEEIGTGHRDKGHERSDQEKGPRPHLSSTGRSPRHRASPE
ncbi:hypothetical protein PIB19_20665 [Sphingomonas sp. 7/4-4]|uniref:hypothetical protein n=1 Tax=Sphingomonas sp. 7/4-4 TaxID=3018446 RepID=UPI0022F39CCE|nr:hypothetical protein [Sphingomonas sp. 7/4-4]WBY07676.1 hypothetical protein PIB19_20665 [Sphingomonas sp. 7/4-4]